MFWDQVSLVFFYGMITALATGLGALPLYFKTHVHRFLGAGQVIAAALMTSASVMLLQETAGYSVVLTGFGLIAGILFVMFADRFTDLFPSMTRVVESNDYQGARQGFLIIFIMTIHSAAEGIGVGVSFGGGEELGVLISLTIALHNIPEGLAIALITVPSGMRVSRAALWSIFSSLPQPVIGVVAFMFVSLFEPLLPFGMGMAAGAMFWMVGHELLPEARKTLEIKRITVIFIITCLCFVGFTYLL